jgi:fructose-bisphosphate aldolase class II
MLGHANHYNTIHLPLISPTILYNHCYGKYAIAAVNVFTMEQVLALFEAAQLANAPIIVQVTPVARNYANPDMMLSMIHAAARIYPQTIYAIHLDHGIEEHAINAIETGYTSVMIDASHENFETNISRTKAIVDIAHTKGVQVEAELGVLSGVEDDINIDAAHSKFTNPKQAKEFVQLTNCDSLAIAVGTSHGAYKFEGEAFLRLDILAAIQNELPNYPLVLHGSSSVKKEIIDSINKHGGRLNQNANGVSDDDIKNAIPLGICKINIATDLRLLWTKVHRAFFNEQPALFDPMIPGKAYIKEYKEFMLERFELLNSTGQSKKIIL